MAEDSKYLAIVKLFPKIFWVCIGVAIVVLAIGIGFSEAFRGESDVTKYLFHKQKDLQIAQVEVEQEKIKASDDYSPAEKELILGKLEEVKRKIEDVRESGENEHKYGYYQKDLEWTKDEMGKYSKLWMIITDWHLTRDCPFPNPKNSYERWCSYIYLLAKCIEIEESDYQIKKNAGLIKKLNEENVEIYLEKKSKIGEKR